MKTITKITDPISCEIAPGVYAPVQIVVVEIKLIRGLSEITGSNNSVDRPPDGVFLPLRTLFVSRNSDDTFAVLSDLVAISPETARTTAKYVIAALIDSETIDPITESQIRTLLALVEPVRQSRTISQYTNDTQRGAFDELVKLYAGDKLDPRKWVATSLMLPKGQLVRPTFQRAIKALSLLKTKPAAKKDEAAISEIEPIDASDRDKPTKETTPACKQNQSNNDPVFEPGEQCELF